MKKVLITGITGQDGYYLTKLLLEKGYEIHGIVRRNSQHSLGNLRYLSEEERENNPPLGRYYRQFIYR